MIDRCTIMGIVRVVITEDIEVWHVIVLDICWFTVDVTLKSSRLYKSLKNEIHLRSGRNQYYQCMMGCTWNTVLSKDTAQKM